MCGLFTILNRQTQGAFEWLNKGRYVGRRVIDSAAKTMKFSIYDVSNVAAIKKDDQAVRIVKPADVPPQPWDYRKAAKTEQRGENIVTETVTLGPSHQVGTSKHGGGTSSRLPAARLLVTLPAKCCSARIIRAQRADQRSMPVISGKRPREISSLCATRVGLMVLCRHLKPAAEGKYSWLSSGTYLSSPPGFGAGGLQISMYKSQ